MAKSVKDTTINDVEDAVSEKIETVQEDVHEKLADLQERAEDLRERSENKVNGFNGTQKALLLVGGTIVVASIVQAVFNRFRKPVEETIVVAVPVAEDDEV